MSKPSKELHDLKGKVYTTSDRNFNFLIPDLQKEAPSLKAQVGVLASRTPTEAPGEQRSTEC